jgi:hypothetical protein
VSDFKDTSNWKKKNESTILYQYKYEGKQNEAELEKEPHGLLVEVEKLSLMDMTAWAVADKKVPERTAGFKSAEYIKVEGRLDLDRVHAFTLDKAPAITFDRITVSVYPIPLDVLQASSVYERWSFFGAEERPDEGWLKDEHGRIVFNDVDEYSDKPHLTANLRLDQATFDSVAQKIKAGGTIRTAQLEILADLYQFRYDSEFVSRYSPANYGLLYEGKSKKYFTKARLDQLRFEWSPKLARPTVDTAALAPPPSVFDDDPAPLGTDEHLISQVAEDVKQIRSRMNIFYQAAVAALVFLVISQVLNWLGLSW